MKKILLFITCLIVVLSGNVVKAQESENNSVFLSGNFKFVSEQTDEKSFEYNTYDDNGNLLYSSYYKDDGNLYMLIDGEETLAITINVNPQLSIEKLPTFRAPSNFLETSTGYVQAIKINANVIDAGKVAVENALGGFIMGYWSGLGFKGRLVNAGKEALSGLASYIIENYDTYDTSVIRNNYIYNGCDWLLYTEFQFPSNYTVGSYAWKDNPVLGVAPYVCKMASQSYPY